MCFWLFSSVPLYVCQCFFSSGGALRAALTFSQGVECRTFIFAHVLVRAPVDRPRLSDNRVTHRMCAIAKRLGGLRWLAHAGETSSQRLLHIWAACSPPHRAPTVCNHFGLHGKTYTTQTRVPNKTTFVIKRELCFAKHRSNLRKDLVDMYEDAREVQRPKWPGLDLNMDFRNGAMLTHGWPQHDQKVWIQMGDAFVRCRKCLACDRSRSLSKLMNR